MTALPQPKFPVKNPQPQRTLRRRAANAVPTASKFSQHRQTVSDRPLTSKRPAIFPQQNLSVKLQLLMVLQKASFGIALVSMAGSTVLYLSSVRIPQLWSKEYQKLEVLQRQERQLTEINETLKYQMARQAEKEESQLSSLNPDDAVFISPAELKLEQPANTDGDRRKEIAFKYATPGY